MEKRYFKFESLFSYKTDLNADSVEWCPHTPNQNVFVCGNYQLVEQNVIFIFLLNFSNKYFFSLHHPNV